MRERGAEAWLVPADITTDEGVALLFARAAELGAVTGLVNNAGATLHIGPLVETPGRGRAPHGRAQPDLGHPVRPRGGAADEHQPRRHRRRRGQRVVGRRDAGRPNEYVQYAAAKAGLDALTTGLAVEVAGEGIRVVGVAPGIVNTTIHADAGEPGRMDRVGPLVPLGRVGEPVEVADAIGWLMSDQASYVTGTTLRVAGGR